MRHRIWQLRSVTIALIALALSAGLAFGATPQGPAWGLANAASHAGKTVPVVGDEEETLSEDEDATDEDQDVEETEDTTETEDASETADNCLTDPTTLTAEDLAAMSHGSVVCWAAHQTEWPAWFANHGAFVRCWAHQGKEGAASCTEDPAAVDESVDETQGDTTEMSAPSHGKGLGKLKTKSKGRHGG